MRLSFLFIAASTPQKASIFQHRVPHVETVRREFQHLVPDVVKGFYESVGLLMTGATTNTFSGFDPVINDDILSKILIPIK